MYNRARRSVCVPGWRELRGFLHESPRSAVPPSSRTASDETRRRYSARPTRSTFPLAARPASPTWSAWRLQCRAGRAVPNSPAIGRRRSPTTSETHVAMTASSIGCATALDSATEAIDRLHSTANSHHRIVVAEIMGHRAGWLALGAGIAGGGGVILLPEIPYDVQKIADAIKRRSRHATNFSI